MKNITIVITVVFLLISMGCAGMTDTEQRTLSGGAIGAGAGAVIGAISGHTLMGAAVGAAAGAGGGYLYDKNQKSKEEAYKKGYEEGQKSK
jgi:osmotically inducible lipoprotein OsmB